MNTNGGRWDETGTPDWTNAQYLTLTQAEVVTSVRTYQYGVLTFDAYSDDWSDVLLGFFKSDQADYAIFDSNTFTGRKFDIASPPSTAVVLTDSTWYHFQIIWCPQFTQLKVWEFDGTLIGNVKFRNPPPLNFSPLPDFRRSGSLTSLLALLRSLFFLTRGLNHLYGYNYPLVYTS